MSRELHGIVTPVLKLLAGMMRSGDHLAVAGMGGGGFNWPGVVEEQREPVTAFLREEMEQLTNGGLTVCAAAQTLRPSGSVGQSLFLVAVCIAPRPEGSVTELHPADFLYAIIAPSDLDVGLAAKRLK